jgi:hypothetical protein
MWSSLPPEARAAMLYILSHILGSERPSYFSMAGLKSLGYLLTVNFRQPSYEFTFNVGIDLLF